MGASVLVVEDNRAVNDLLMEGLSEAGYRCFQAFSGLDAIALAEEVRPDAIILDLNLPQLHGFEVLRQVRRKDPYTVVLVVTGHGSEQTAGRALRLGADDYLQKPVRHAPLCAALEKHLRRAEKKRWVESSESLAVGVSEEQLGKVFFCAPVALVYVDGDDAICAVNQSAARLLGRKPEELLGLKAGALVPEDLRPHWLESVRREAVTGRGYEGEVFLQGVGAEAIPVSISASQRPDDRHLVLALRDLTLQKAMEERYFESRKLASLGRVVEGVAHEVRNPLISIGGFARKLLRQLDDGRSQQFLGVILSEVQRLEKMVADIEAYVQFTKHRRPVFGPVALGELLGDVLRRVPETGAEAAIRRRFERAEPDPVVYADAGLLRELFGGLVVNACDAMPKGGDLAVTMEVAGNWVRVRVVDTGVGIPEEDLGEIFDPFFTSKTSGAGLGLAKAYMIVEEHAGNIEFESQVGRGTACTVNLPIDRRRVPRTAP